MGDRIEVTGFDVEPMLVTRINLLTTETLRLDGRHYIIPNALLQASPIVQHQRSGEVALDLTFDISAQTAPAAFQELRERIGEYLRTCAAHPWNVKDNFIIYVESIENSNRMRFHVWVGLRGVKWQHIMRWLVPQTDLFLKVQAILNEMGIAYELPVQPVGLRDRTTKRRRRHSTDNS